MAVEGQVSAAQESLRPPIYPEGFSSDVTSIVFFFFFFCTGMLCLVNRRYRDEVTFRNTLVLGVISYAGFNWTNWVRNAYMRKHFAIGLTHGRTVFAWPHWDINKLSFFLQEARALSMFLLLAFLWQAWIAAFRESVELTEKWTSQATIDNFGERAGLLSDRFSEWQCQSVLLVVAFLPWSLFYWRSVSDLGDTRYIMAGILLHIVWVTTWLILSLSLLQVWRQWSNYRLQVLSSLAGTQESSDQAERTIKILLEATPVSSLKIFGAGSVIVSSLLIPLLNVLFR